MMMKFLLMAMTSLLVSAGYAQSTQTGTLTVCGRWHGYQAADASQLRKAKPAVLVYEKHLNADLNNFQTVIELDIQQDSFFVSIPLTKPQQYVGFNGYAGDRYHWPGITTLFLVNPGDSLHLILRQDSLPTISSNNPTLAFQFQLAGISDQLFALGSGKGMEAQIDRGLTEIHERLAAAGALNGRASKRANPYMHALCMENFRYSLLSGLCQRLYISASSSKWDTLQPSLADKLCTAFAPFLHVSDERVITASSTYLTFRFYYHSAMGVLTARLAGFTRENNLQIANHAYRDILLLPDPTLKEQVLLQFFGSSRDFRRLGRDGLPLVEDVLKHISDPDVHAQLQSLRNNLAGGEQVPDIDFFDLQGNPVGFGDFPGKIILAHFWYRGCAACATLSSELHPVLERYRDHTDVVFLNINVDRAHEKWLAGLTEGKYHVDPEIILNTGSEGISHPFLRHYGFKSFPQVVLADQQGKLVSLRTYRSAEETEGEVLGRLIAELLN